MEFVYPHPLETDALKNMISVAILKKPFVPKWQRNKNSFYDLFKERSS